MDEAITATAAAIIVVLVSAIKTRKVQWCVFYAFKRYE